MQMLDYRIELRDSKGRFAPLTRARTFVIRGPRGGKLSRRITFPPSIRLYADRFDLIEQVIQTIEQRKEMARIRAKERQVLRKREQLMTRIRRTRKPKKKAELIRELFALGGELDEAHDLILYTAHPSQKFKRFVPSKTKRRVLEIRKLVFDTPMKLMDTRTFDETMNFLDPYLKRALMITRNETKGKGKELYLKLKFTDASDPKNVQWVSAPRESLKDYRKLDDYLGRLTEKLHDSFVRKEKYFSPSDTFFVDQVVVEGTDHQSAKVISDDKLRRIARMAQEEYVTQFVTPARRGAVMRQLRSQGTVVRKKASKKAKKKKKKKTKKRRRRRR